MSENKVTVKLINKKGEEIDAFQMRAGLNLWVFIRKRGHPIGAACSGVGVCAACDVTVVEGSATALTPQNDFERENLRRHGKPETSRLACLVRVFEDVSVQADYW